MADTANVIDFASRAAIRRERKCTAMPATVLPDLDVVELHDAVTAAGDGPSYFERFIAIAALFPEE